MGTTRKSESTTAQTAPIAIKQKKQVKDTGDNTIPSKKFEKGYYMDSFQSENKKSSSSNASSKSHSRNSSTGSNASAKSSESSQIVGRMSAEWEKSTKKKK